MVVIFMGFELSRSETADYFQETRKKNLLHGFIIQLLMQIRANHQIYQAFLPLTVSQLLIKIE